MKLQVVAECGTDSFIVKQGDYYFMTDLSIPGAPLRAKTMDVFLRRGYWFAPSSNPPIDKLQEELDKYADNYVDIGLEYDYGD